jgi:hypothetical protein
MGRRRIRARSPPAAGMPGTTAWLTVLCVLVAAVILAAFVMGVVALVWLGKLQAQGAIPAHAQQAETRKKPAAVFRHAQYMQEKEPGLYYLGDGVYPGAPGRVDGYAMMMYADGTRQARRFAMDEPEAVNGSVEACVEPFAVGAYWKAPFTVVVDPDNDDDIPRSLFIGAIHHAFSEWDSRVANVLVSGQNTAVCADGVDQDSPDGKNEAMLGFVDDPAVLAVTVLWGVFTGPIPDRRLLEMDMLFNRHFAWGDAALNPDVFDMKTVATHEAGHAVGFGHTSTALATMAPTAALGETHKRDILPCEAAALCQLYQDAACAHANGTGHKPPTFVDTGCGLSPGGSPPSGGGGGGSPPAATPQNPAPRTAGAISVVVLLLAALAAL